MNLKRFLSQVALCIAGTLVSLGANQPPTISNIPDRTIAEDGSTPPINFTVSDLETPAGLLVVHAASSNPPLVPVANIVLGGSGANRTVKVTPSPNRCGTVVITLTVTDLGGATANDSFTLTVICANDPPTLNAIANRSLCSCGPPKTVNLSGINAGPGEAQVLTVTATSDNPSVLPNPMVTYASPNTTGTLTLNPVPNSMGTAVVTVRVNDGQANNNLVTRTFTVTVTKDTAPPVFSNCPTDLVVRCAGAKLYWPMGATDDCSGATVTCVPPTGQSYAAGPPFTVTCTATDGCGKTSTCQFRVQVTNCCLVVNPSFEKVTSPLPAPGYSSGTLTGVEGWSSVTPETPDIFTPPNVPNNVFGSQSAYDGTNYAGFRAGFVSGTFQRERLFGTLSPAAITGKCYRVTARFSLADTSPTNGVPVQILLLASIPNGTLIVPLAQKTITRTDIWELYDVTVKAEHPFDRIMIRAVNDPAHTYPLGYVYVDSVNVCPCPSLSISHVAAAAPSATTRAVAVSYRGNGVLEEIDAVLFNPQPEPPGGWREVTLPATHYFDEHTIIYEFNPQPEPPGSPLRFFRIRETDIGPTAPGGARGDTLSPTQPAAPVKCCGQ